MMFYKKLKNNIIMRITTGYCRFKIIHDSVISRGGRQNIKVDTKGVP